jgi:cation diffusion facilitator CzcD-associated flavoprotein CzcO
VSAREPRITIVGAGFGGLGLAVRLKRSGIEDFLILEKSDGVGGVWRENTYPGAGCDVPSHLYSFSFEPKLDWSHRYAAQPEILAYLQHCAEKYALKDRILFNTEVDAADFDDSLCRWRVRTSQGDRKTRFLVFACGQLSRPAWPDIPGLEGFRGKHFHSAQWDHHYDLSGKRVAVIGTGASAIQFVPRIAGRVKQLHLFQRSPPYVLPKPDRPYRPWEKALLARFPWLHTLSRAKQYGQHEVRVMGLTWLQPLTFWLGAICRRHLERNIQDPGLRARLTPDYPIGCKRVLLSNDFYPALNRSNVALVTDAVKEVKEDCILTSKMAAYPVDAILLGTGFQASEFLAPMRIRGRNGRDLNEVWRGGAKAYLGITVAGFPNLFILYGPNTNLGHNSIVYMLESQFTYVISAIQFMKDREDCAVDVRPEVMDRFHRKLERQMRRTVWAKGCTSWYKTAEGKVTNNWPGFTFVYRLRTRRFRPEEYIFLTGRTCHPHGKDVS